MPQRRIFWAANVRTKSFLDRLAAAKAGSFTEMSIFPVDVKTMLESGQTATLADLKHMAADAGVRIAVLDPFARWVPNVTPASWASASDVAFTDFNEGRIF